MKYQQVKRKKGKRKSSLFRESLSFFLCHFLFQHTGRLNLAASTVFLSTTTTFEDSTKNQKRKKRK